MHGVIPRQLEGLSVTFTIAHHPRERAWVFVCRDCGSEIVCSCWSNGELTARQLYLLRNHRHSGEGRP